MDYLALATDGDGTLIRSGHMSRNTLAALRRWKQAGGKLILVTGETVSQLADFPHLELVDRIVAENGALIVGQHGTIKRKFGKPPPRRLMDSLAQAGIKAQRGRLILQAQLDDEHSIAEVLRELKSDWKLVRNRHQLMVLPPGVDKATGLIQALRELRISPRQVVAVGDAENDCPLLGACGLAVAVHNAVPKLKKKSQHVTDGGAGRGIAELIDALLSGTLGTNQSTRSRKINGWPTSVRTRRYSRS